MIAMSQAKEGFSRSVHAEHTLRWAWSAALVCFIIAAGTGALLRFAMLYGSPWGLALQNIRHGHSHLMYFGWATPALMALIFASLLRATGRAAGGGANVLLTVTFAASLLAYPAFLLFGYQPVQVGNAQLPLSTMASGLNVLVWYAFIFYYWKTTRGVARYMPLRLWDAALAFLFLSSLGAWGLALSAVAGITSPLVASALTHLFLDLFADGWFLLAVLGLAFLALPAAAASRTAQLGENLLVAGLPLTFLLSVPSSALPPAVRALAGLSAVCAATGLLAMLYALFSALSAAPNTAQRWLWRVSFFFLALKGLAFLVMSMPAGAQWSVGMGLRISYLHWLLLGGITVGLLAAARRNWGVQAVAFWRLLLLSIIILLLSLLPLTRLWPSLLSGRWALEAAAWIALGPVLSAILVLFGSRRSKKKTTVAGVKTTVTPSRS